MKVDFKTASVELSSDAELAPVKVGSEVEQLQALRAEAIARSKSFNAGEYSFGRPASYYVDRAGEESSAWDFGTLTTMVALVQLPSYGHYTLLLHGSYNPKTGHWTDGNKVVRISELRAAVTARIEQLGLSFVSIYEYAITPRSEEDRKAFERLSFEERIERFRRTQ